MPSERFCAPTIVHQTLVEDILQKARSKDTLVKELLDAIPIPDIDKDVSSSEDKSKFPSHKLKIDAHVKGTTWDFCVGGDSDKQADAHSSDDRVAAPLSLRTRMAC